MRRAVFLCVILAAGCCSTTKEAADALAGAWVLIEPDAVSGMEARVNALELATTPEADREAMRERMKTTERRQLEEFKALIEEIQRAAK